MKRFSKVAINDHSIYKVNNMPTLMLKFKSNLHQKIHNNLLVALSASIPLFFLLSSYLTALLILNWLIAGNFREIIPVFRKQKLFFATILIFFAFVLGLLHTENLSEGLKDIEHKLSLLLIPLVVFTSGKLTKQVLNRILIAFAVTTLVVSAIALSISFYKYLNTGITANFFYHQLANNVRMHAVYLSCYLAFSFFIVLGKVSFKSTNYFKTLPLFFILIFIIGLLLLLSSKTIIAAFLVALTVYIILKSRTSNKFVFGIATILVLNFVIVVTLYFIPYTHNRFEQVVNTKFEVLEKDRFNYDTEFSGLSLRLLFWKFALLINERENAEIFGVGTGDSKDKLNEIYREYNLYLGNQEIKGDTGYLNYNTHSQFVEIYLKVGIIALLLFILYFGILLYTSIKQKDALFTIWLIIFISFSITETTLQVNKGIVFFSFFVSVLLAATRINTHNIKIQRIEQV